MTATLDELLGDIDALVRLTVGEARARGLTCTGTCHGCGRERTGLDLAAIKSLADHLTLAEAGARLTCKDCRERRVRLVVECEA